MERIRKHIVFHGEVQGVGFRWRAMRAAEMQGCTGWVRNEWDGSVTMEIQGNRYGIEAVLESLQKGAYIRIENTEEKEVPLQEEEREFRVLF
ncbi:MAG: acylphosphatase [Solobacterium sp.]|nr:acylphosphatase [Solobacterium sp.]